MVLGNNIEDEVAQEIFNRLSKSVVQRMGPNKTFQSVKSARQLMISWKLGKNLTVPVFTRLLSNTQLEIHSKMKRNAYRSTTIGSLKKSAWNIP